MGVGAHLALLQLQSVQDAQLSKGKWVLTPVLVHREMKEDLVDAEVMCWLLAEQ